MPLLGTILRQFCHSLSSAKWDICIMFTDSKALARCFSFGKITALIFD